MKSFLESERVAAHKVILHRFAEWHAMLDRRQAELLAQLDDYADFERQRMENQVSGVFKHKATESSLKLFAS